MKKLRFIKTLEDADIDEKAVQKLIEGQLDQVEEGLQYVASFVPIGTGIIDTLALDDTNRPVIIEFKRATKDFDGDALIQLMRYYSWFVADENHVLHLKSIIQKFKPEIQEVSEDIRLIAIVGSVGDDIKNACLSLAPPIKLLTYSLVQGSSNEEIGVIINPILDTSIGGEIRVSEPKTEEDHLRGYDNLRPVYEELKKRILEIDQTIKINPAPKYYIGVGRRIYFAWIHVKTQWIRLDLLITPEEAKDSPRYKKWDSDSGYVQISSVEDIDDELINWIKLAYEKAG